MHSVQAILEQKGYAIFTTSPESPVWQALQLMARRDVGSLLVMDDERICGILTERDYVWRVAHGKDDLLHGKVSDVMNSLVHRISPERSLDGAMRLMTNHRVRHLVVEENGRAIGMISIGDVVSTLLEDQTAEIDELRRHLRDPQELTS